MFLHLKWKNINIYNYNFNNENNNSNNTKEKNINNTGFHLFSSIISIIEIILSCIIFSTLIFHKRKLSRIDLLVITKNILYTFIFSLFLFFSIQKQMYIVDKHYNYATSRVSCFYVSFSYALHIATNIEHFKSIRNPCYVIKYMINNAYNISKHSIISFIVSVIITIIPYFFQDDIKNIYDYIFTLTEDDYFDITISKNKILSPIILIFFIILFYLYLKTKLFYSVLKEKSLLHLKYSNICLLISNFLYLLLSIFLFILPLLSDITNISKIIQVIFYIISIGDSYLYLFKMFHSGFFYYYLNSTLMGFIIKCLCFGCCFSNSSFPNTSLTSLTTKHTLSIYKFYSYLDYVVEDYILDTLDFILYAITTGLSIVYKDFQDKDYHFKSKNDFLSIESAANNQGSDMNSSDNSNNNKNILNINEIDSDSNEKNEEEDLSSSSTYNFFKVYSKTLLKDKLENDLFSFSYCGDAYINITPLFVKESIEAINLYKISKNEIINSLLSNKFLSLLMTNSKKIFFKKLNNLIIKTYDNKLLIEMHTDLKTDSDFVNLLKNYFYHINYSNVNTFLCVLIGVFKVRINNYKEILIFVSKNPFIENVPKDFYNYWELMRFNIDKKKFNKILSSKDGDSFVISSNVDSLLSLTRNNNLFQLEDFNFFQETIKNDLKFLKSISSSNFCLLILYYEFEANKNLSKDYSIFSKIRIKLINDSNSNSDLFKSRKINLSSSNFSSSNISENNNFNTSPNKNIPINLFDDTAKEIFINFENKKKIDDDISDIPLISNDSKSLVMKNGFETFYNNFKGILYFRWENIFYQDKNKSKRRFYSDYADEVLQYFSS